MENGFPNYSCQIQVSKTATNFLNKDSSKVLKYCGTVLHPLTLQCRPNFENWFGRNVLYASNLAMTYPQSVMAFIERKMLFVCTIHFKPLYFDQELNSLTYVIQNIYEASYLTALKLHSLLTSLIFAKGEILPGQELFDLTTKLTGKMVKKYKRIVRISSLTNSIDEELVKHTIRYAFITVLQRKFSRQYKGQKLPWVNFNLIPKVLLDECLKNRRTNSILSKNYYKL